MAICIRPRPVLVAEPGREPIAAGTGADPATDTITATNTGTAVAPETGTDAAADNITATDTGKAVGPEARYLWFAAFVIVVGGVGGTLIHDHWAKSVSFAPPQGIGIFALFYIIAQVIERVQEPIVPYLGQAKDPGEEENGRKNQRQAKGALERAIVAGFDQPEKGSGQTTREADVANRERCVDQIRANLTVLIFGTSALLAMLISGYLRAGLLRTVGESGIPAWVDIVVTGLVIGAGTKPLHDLISNISASKVEKQKPPSVA